MWMEKKGTFSVTSNCNAAFPSEMSSDGSRGRAAPVTAGRVTALGSSLDMQFVAVLEIMVVTTPRASLEAQTGKPLSTVR